MTFKRLFYYLLLAAVTAVLGFLSYEWVYQGRFPEEWPKEWPWEMVAKQSDEPDEQGGGPCPGGAKPKYWKAPMDPTYIRDKPGKSPMGMDLVPACPAVEEAKAKQGDGPCPGGAKPRYWKAPMDPTYIRDKPGKSPMGMDLVPVCPAAGESETEKGIRIDPSVVQNIGVRTAPVERRDLARNIRTVGRIDYDERLVKHVHTKIQGWIEKLHVEYVGQEVELNQPLLEIYSPELVSTQEELLLAARYRSLMEKSKFQDIVKGGEALFEASRRRLELWDIPESEIEQLLETGEIKKTLTLYAPTEGVVTKLNVRAGMEVDPNDNLFTIADLSQVWVYADIYEYELPWIAVGQQGAVELSYLPGTVFEGELTYIYPFLDPKTRTATVRLELSNPDGVLKPEMFANVTIESEVRPNVIAVPQEAIIRSGKRSLVVVSLGRGRFEPREIKLGLDSGDGWIEIMEGLREGESILVSSQFLIDSESNLQEAVRKLLGERSRSRKGKETAKPPPASPSPTSTPPAGHPQSGDEEQTTLKD